MSAAIMAILLLSPSVALAQSVPPHVFLGSATISGSPAADGTVVAALVDGRQVAASTVSSGSYVVEVKPDATDNFAGKTVTFKIGGFPSAETAFWEMGGLTGLDLNSSPALRTPTLIPTPTPIPTPVLVPGDQGEPGRPGARGPQGVQGPSGPPGSAGAAGPAGEAGPTGSQGPTGLGGDPGSNGSSLFGILAFAVAILALLGTFGGMLWRRLVE